jgi:DNA-binding LacI/PurR family transcriptional regulator
MNTPTIADVAERAGVSKGLVSFVINDRPGVKAETRERILQAAAELGWRPSPHARGLKSRSAYALGLVVLREPEVIGADPFFPAFIAGVESVLAGTGRVMLLSVAPDERTELETYRALTAERRIDGFLLTDLRHDDPRVELLEELGMPAVTLGRPTGPSTFPAIERDYEAGITAMVELLRDAGHTDIAHVSGRLDMIHGSARRDIFVDCAQRLGMRPVVVAGDFSPRNAAELTRELLSRPDRPTAIVYANDPTALAGMSVAAEQGLRLPDDLSVCSMDGSHMAEYVFPALATVGNDPAEWGRAAATVLLDVIENGTAADTALPPARTLPRGSVAPPRSGPNPVSR